MENKQKLIELSTELQHKRISMVPQELFDTIIRHLDNINKINGDIVECGVWKGGFSIFMATAFPTKNIWVVDSFEGFQPLEIAKYQYLNNIERHIPSYSLGLPNTEDDFTLDKVKERFKNYQLDSPRIKFIKGFVKDSLPTSKIEKIALLRIDVDAYSATREVLDELYDKVQPGGYIIFDDMCLYECVDAVKDFLEERNLPKIIFHPITDEQLNLDTSTNLSYPAGSYIIKQ
jgi:O-methyltransferase